MIGRAKAWDFHLKSLTDKECDSYRKIQYERTVQIIRKYNKTAVIVLNVDFGHTDPQISLPYGKLISINANKKCIEMIFLNIKFALKYLTMSDGTLGQFTA